MPAHADALRVCGTAFLSAAFRAFGALSGDNGIARITAVESCPGGSTGQKLFLSVEYERPAPGLHRDLFVKFSRDFSDPLRDDRGKHEMKNEVRLAALSRLPHFPIQIPRVYFADYHEASCTGLLITERIAFGCGGIEPHHAKCLDHELTGPIHYYRLIVKALARLAAAHKSGRLSPETELRLPFAPQLDGRLISYDERQLSVKLADFAAFAARHPQLYPARLTTPAFFAQLERDARGYLRHEPAVRRFLNGNADFIALCHWNANIDNAWFWRDPAGVLNCGLMDWGHVGQMNVAFALWGSLSAAALEIWDDHLDELLALFTAELACNGGPRLDVEELRLHLELHVAMMGLAYFIDSPSRILLRLPDVERARGPRDPLFRANDTARNQLHISTVVLNFWQAGNLGASLQRLLRRPERNIPA